MSEGHLEPEQGVDTHSLRERILDLFETYQDSFDKHQWPLEVHRWYELVRCLISAVEGRFDPQARAWTATRLLVDLQLLEIPALANCGRTPLDGAAGETRAAIQMVLTRTGFAAEQADRMVTALSALARVIDETYQARIQALLREHSGRLIDAVLQELPLADALGPESARLTVTHWLQNVLNLPILVDSPGLQAMCKRANATPNDVLAVADQLGINAGLVDEILNRWVGAYPVRRAAGESVH